MMILREEESHLESHERNKASMFPNHIVLILQNALQLVFIFIHIYMYICISILSIARAHILLQS